MLIQIKSKAQGKAGFVVTLPFALIRDEDMCRLLLQALGRGRLCESLALENI